MVINYTMLKVPQYQPVINLQPFMFSSHKEKKEEFDYLVKIYYHLLLRPSQITAGHRNFEMKWTLNFHNVEYLFASKFILTL